MIVGEAQLAPQADPYRRERLMVASIPHPPHAFVQLIMVLNGDLPILPAGEISGNAVLRFRRIRFHPWLRAALARRDAARDTHARPTSARPPARDRQAVRLRVFQSDRDRQFRQILATRYGLTRMPRFAAPYRREAAETADRGEAPSASRLSRPSLRTLARAPFAVRVLNHLTYGATAQSVADFKALGSDDSARLGAFVEQQLAWQSIDDSALETRLANAGYTTLGKSLKQLWADHVAADPAYDVRMRPAWEVQRAALVRAAHSRRQLLEMVVNFWHDHFNVTASDFSAGPVYVHYHRDVLRRHALGNFREMLEAVASSTSMLYYLDNRSNTRAGPNENFGRELLELHTMGVENYLGFADPTKVPPCPEDPDFPIGYTDSDVYETAACFTGWTVRDGHWEYPAENDGTFTYHPDWHDNGPKLVLGMYVPLGQGNLKDGRDVLDRLAQHPRVAKFVCGKLIRRFIGDKPPQALVDSAAAGFRQNWRQPDQIASTLRHILTSDALFNSWGQKVRRPFEAMAAAMRVLGGAWTPRIGDDDTDELMWRMGFTGHVPYAWPAPNGYPDTAVAWSGANTFGMTWKLLNWLTETRDASDAPLMPVLATTRAGVPAAQWTANRLVDFWCMRILGYLPVASRRAKLVAFMAQNGDPATYVIADDDNWSANDLKKHYNQQRLRSLVSLILLSPEFLSR